MTNTEVLTLSLDEQLDGMMQEREWLLVRLGQLEDKLIKYNRLKARTKPPQKRRDSRT